MNEFLPKIAEILEVDEVTPEQVFRDCTDFDSMKGFSIIVLLEAEYGKQMTVDQFMACTTVGDLAAFAGVA